MFEGGESVFRREMISKAAFLPNYVAAYRAALLDLAYSYTFT
jgi:hypothetical protein